LAGGDFTMLGGQPRGHIGRLDADGSLDATFNAGAGCCVWTIALQSDGNILLGGSFTDLNGEPRQHIGRLHSDGGLDGSFDPVADGFVLGLAVQADGKILMGGDFISLNGQRRDLIGRLTSGGPALQRLALDVRGMMMTWSRSGSGPEVEQVTFEQSLDGTNYTALGRATRISGGWQLTGLSFPIGQTFYLRARGRSLAGRFNGSSGLIESVAQFYRIAPPQLTRVMKDGSGVFQFAFSNVNATAFTVLAATNVSSPMPNWEVLGGPVPVGNSVYQFTDPSATNHTRRFYQLRSP
jgi:hypothetical protein